MLSKEDLFYIQILKDFIHKNKTELKEDIDFLKILEYARIQNTNGIVFYQCKDIMPKEYLSGISTLYAAEIYAYGTQISLTNQITEKFKENNIDYFVFKGPIVSSYYPVASLRTMGDSDIMVHENDLDRACQIMIDLGYKQEESDKEKAFFKNGKEVEIHTHMLYPSKNRGIEEMYLCDKCWDYVKDNTLDETFHFTYLLLHIRKHLFGIGVGIRPFLDLAVIMNKTNINFEFIDKEFEKLNLTQFKNVVLSMISKWFDVGEVTTNLTVDFFEEETKKILKNGSHGHANKENKTNKTFMMISGKENQINIKNRLRYLKEIFFPNYTSMLKMKNYKFLRNKKYLLPIAWLYRFILSLINNKAIKVLKNSFNSIFLSNKKMNAKQKSRDNWGL